MKTIVSFLSMNGYGFFVWTSYSLMAVILIFNLTVPLYKFKQLKNELRGKC